MNQSELQKLVDSTLEGMEGFAVEVSLSASNDIKVLADLFEGHISIAQIKTISRAIASEAYVVLKSSSLRRRHEGLGGSHD